MYENKLKYNFINNYILISENLCNLCLKITFAVQLNKHYV